MPVSAKRLATNAIWNIAGQVLPLLAGIVILPILIRVMGLDRYGFITIVWVLIGYAGLFDFGISRAMTRVVAQRLARAQAQEALHVANVSTTFLLLFGLVIGLLMAALSAVLVEHWLGIPESMRVEALHAFWILCVSIPVVMLTAGYRACLEAHQQFAVLSVIRVFMGLATYLGPLLALAVSVRLEAVVGAVVLMRIIANGAHAWACRAKCGFRYRPERPDAAITRELFTLGGWISVSNFVSPLLTYLDRLILGGLVAIRLVAFYATPYDLVSKILIVPYSMMGVLFPAAAGLDARSEQARSVYQNAVRALFVVNFPAVFVFVALADPGLNLWLGADFAAHAAPVLKILAIGLLFNILAQAPATMIQAVGQPKWMAIVHVFELPIFLLALWFFTDRFGIVGTAIASALRFTVDSVVMVLIAERNLIPNSFRVRSLPVPVVLGASLLGAAFVPKSGFADLLTAFVGVVLFALYAWYGLLRAEERARATGWLRARVSQRRGLAP
jgi:O-antigen/teichoic acid export membrane protein